MEDAHQTSEEDTIKTVYIVEDGVSLARTPRQPSTLQRQAYL